MSDSHQGPSLAEVIAGVEHDCREGMSSLVWPTGFTVLPPTGDPSDPLRNREHTVVSWEMVAVHGHEDQPPQVWSTEGPMRSQLQRTHRWVTVKGVTIVHHADGRPWSFERHVDWNGLAAQIGVSMGCLSSDPVE